MDKKYQIFISSTYKDLIEERNKVRDVILSMYHFPIGMEMFNAADEEQWEIIKETIDSSDYYILIIGKRYGTEIQDGPDAGISYTEKEFRYAKNVGIPVLAFIKDDAAVTSNNMDLDPEKIKKLNDFVETVKDKREVDWFSSVEDLGTKVTLALHKQFSRKNRPGWIRSDKLDMEQTLNEIIKQNQQIRLLESENKELRERIESKMPHLGIDIILNGTIEAPLSEKDMNNEGEIVVIDNNKRIIKRRSDIARNYLGNTNPLTMNDIPPSYITRVTQSDLDEYNNNLPDAETINAYNEHMHLYNSVRINGQRMDFELFNDGTAKATDIHVTLEFPNDLFIMDRTKAESFSVPQKPEMPENPLDRVVKRRFGGAKSLYQSFSDFAPQPIAYDTILDNSHFNAAVLLGSKLSRDWNVEIDKNQVNIWAASLLHTRSLIADELCIVPLKEGKFIIKATMICEEYTQPIEEEIEIEVVDAIA